MSRCLRYQKPIICEHLANQYVAGALTHGVRARVETLRQTTPELDRAIAKIADRFADIHWRLPSAPLSPSDSNDLWDSIDAQLVTTPIPPEAEPATVQSGFWSSVLAWKLTTGLSMAMSVLLAIFLVTTPAISPVEPNLVAHTAQGPHYLATMSAHNDTDKAIQFVISAYGKQADKPSRLHLQWSKQHLNDEAQTRLHLWAEDRDTGKLSYIGLQPPKEQSWDLTKTNWNAVSNSGRLLMTNSNAVPTEANTVFSGICLQLNAWKQAESV